MGLSSNWALKCKNGDSFIPTHKSRVVCGLAMAADVTHEKWHLIHPQSPNVDCQLDRPRTPSPFQPVTFPPFSNVSLCLCCFFSHSMPSTLLHRYGSPVLLLRPALVKSKVLKQLYPSCIQALSCSSKNGKGELCFGLAKQINIYSIYYVYLNQRSK